MHETRKERVPVSAGEMKMKSIHRFAFAGLLVAFGAALTPKATAAPPSFVRIPAGTFQMGSPVGEIGRDITETQHSVTLTRDFEMQNLPVTQQQWVDVMGTNPSAFQSPRNCTDYRVVNGVSLCPNHPVEQVSWNDVAAFVKKVNATANDGYTYRLPTEAEWEYAARAGTQTAYSFGNDESQLGQYAWWGANTYVLETHDVGGKAPNPYGLYDMHGNIWQWVGTGTALTAAPARSIPRARTAVGRACSAVDSGSRTARTVARPVATAWTPPIKVRRSASASFARSKNARSASFFPGTAIAVPILYGENRRGKRDDESTRFRTRSGGFGAFGVDTGPDRRTRPPSRENAGDRRLWNRFRTALG